MINATAGNFQKHKMERLLKFAKKTKNILEVSLLMEFLVVYT